YRRRSSDQAILPHHPAAGAPGADGGDHLPRAGRAAHLRPDLRADAELRRHQDHERDLAREPVRVQQVRRRLGAIDIAVPDHRALHHRLYLAGQGELRRGRPLMGATMSPWKLVKTALFYLLVVVIVVVSVFPFYYAILTSFKSGTDLFRITYWPTSFSLDNYRDVLTSGSFPQNVLNSVFVASLTVILALFLAVTAAFALSRVRFRGRGLLLMTILAVSMFPQIAVLAGLFELIRFL